MVLEEETMRIQVEKDVKWVKINANQQGLFRVLYSKDMLSNLKQAVSQLNEIDR